MQTKFLGYIVDPVSGSELKLKVFEKNGDRIKFGLLYNKTSWYPIIDFVPRLLMGELKSNLLQQKYKFYKKFRSKLGSKIAADWKLEIDKISDWNAFDRHQRETANSFAFEWKNIYKENDFEKSNFLHFVGPFLKEADFKDKVTVDIGCGSGRFTKWAAMMGSQVSFGMDLGDSVEAAYKMTRSLDNTCIVQADIYNPPFRSKFDIAYSIGVLHHLPKPKDGFLGLPKVLKAGGRMLIWVYSRRNNNRALYFYEPIRSITNKIDKKLLFALCYIPALVVHIINSLTHLLNWLGMASLGRRVPFFYYANFPFNMKLNDAFDVLATPKSNYYYLEEIEDWFREAKLGKIKAFEHAEAGVTCIGNYVGQK